MQDNFDLNGYLRNNPLLKENQENNNFSTLDDLNKYLENNDYDSIDYDIDLNKLNKALNKYNNLNKVITPEVVNDFLMMMDSESENVDLDEIPSIIKKIWNNLNEVKKNHM